MGELVSLNIADAENAYRPLTDMIIAFTGFPTGFSASNANVKWNIINDGNSIGLFPLQGAVYLRRYVSGSYVAQLPFQIVYKATATTNKGSIDAQDMLVKLSEWLEKGYIQFKDTKIQMESLERTSPVYLYAQDEKHTQYGVNMQLKYSNRR